MSDFNSDNDFAEFFPDDDANIADSESIVDDFSNNEDIDEAQNKESTKLKNNKQKDAVDDLIDDMFDEEQLTIEEDENKLEPKTVNKQTNSEETPELLQRVDRLLQDSKGNLYSPDGKLVAKAGAERRKFETEYTKTVFETLDKQSKVIQQANEKINELQSIANSPTSFAKSMDVTNDFVVNAVSFAKQMKANPDAVLAGLLHQTLEKDESGKALIDLLGDQGVALLKQSHEKLSFMRNIDKPELTKEQQQQEYIKNIIQEKNNFIQEQSNLYANVGNFIDYVLTEKLKNNLTVSYKDAVIEALLYLSEQGFTVNKPIKQQIEERNNQKSVKSSPSLAMANGNRGANAGSIKSKKSNNPVRDDMLSMLNEIRKV